MGSGLTIVSLMMPRDPGTNIGDSQHENGTQTFCSESAKYSDQQGEFHALIRLSSGALIDIVRQASSWTGSGRRFSIRLGPGSTARSGLNVRVLSPVQTAITANNSPCSDGVHPS